MDKLLYDLIQFHRAGDVPVLDSPTILPSDRLKLRKKLINSENDEVQEALDENDLPHILQECLDLIYVAVGTLVESGLSKAAVAGWDALQTSNMEKCDPATGKILKDEDGKILKPEGWKPVDWQKIVDQS